MKKRIMAAITSCIMAVSMLQVMPVTVNAADEYLVRTNGATAPRQIT